MSPIRAIDSGTRRFTAIAALVGLALLAIAVQLSGVNSSPPGAPGDRSGRGDATMFSRVVERVRAGEPYYEAMGDELRTSDYPTGSLFNWRTPLLYLGLSTLPPRLSYAFMLLLGIVLLGLLMLFFARHASPEGTVLGVLFAAAATGTLVDLQGYWLSEAWCGVFIGLSLAAYLRSAWMPAVLCGLVALFFRELAAPYCVVCFVLAWRARRKQELVVWAVGAIFYAVFYGVHITNVMAAMQPGDPSHEGSWIRFGGLAFWLGTIKSSKAIFSAPHFVLTIASVLLLASWWARTLAPHVKWTVALYSVFFLVAGQSFNDYWGFVSAVPFALAISYGPEGLLTLFRQAASVPNRSA